jgi:hypothetical protein
VSENTETDCSTPNRSSVTDDTAYYRPLSNNDSIGNQRLKFNARMFANSAIETDAAMMIDKYIVTHLSAITDDNVMADQRTVSYTSQSSGGT